MAQSAVVRVFDLEVAVMGELYVDGSYKKLLQDIHLGIKERAEQEHNHPVEGIAVHPNTLGGKPVLPSARECFVVRVTSTVGHRVCFLFEWNTLYNTAFYVDDPMVAANRCWYIFSDFAATIALPPVEQFHHVRQKDIGYHILTRISGNYASMGRTSILVGEEAVNGYIRKLHCIRDRLLVGNKLVMDDKLYLDLMKGTLSFGAVVISEPSRLAEYRAYISQFIHAPHVIPTEYSIWFTRWSQLSKAFKAGTGLKVNDKIYLTPDQVKKKLCVLCNSVYLR